MLVLLSFHTNFDMRIVVGITGASGIIYGVRTLEVLHDCGIETELIISKTAQKILELETGKRAEDLINLCKHYYSNDDLFAPISSGSYPTDGMVIVPCSMTTLACIAHGISDNLIRRAAEVTLKEGRKLVLVPRETPLNQIHLENMLSLQRAGAVILPACPAFYHRPSSIQEIVDFVVGKILDIFEIPHQLYRRWKG
jgi:4-hydroxy-3-polyprenylbenzoate decarboxylase